MAKEKQQQHTDPHDQAVTELMEEMTRRQEEEKRAREIKQSKDKFNEKILKLQERTADFIIKYGKEDYRSQIMLTFLNVSLEMRDAINLMDDIGTAFSCITEAIGCMDNILEQNVFQISGTLSTKYGFWERWKRKRMLKKAMKNNVGRMKSTVDMIIGNVRMANDIINSLRKTSVTMQDMLRKNNSRQAKIDAKNNTTGAPLPPSEGERIVDDIIKARGATVPTTTPDGSSSGGAGTPPSGGGVDISDL